MRASYWVLALCSLLWAFLGSTRGQDFYKGYCATCHMPDGKGIPGLYPPLRFIGQYLCLPEGRAYLTRAILFGLVGPLEIEGIVYRGTRYMPAFGEVLDDDTLALVLNDLLGILRSRARPFTPREIREYRTPPATPNGVYQERLKFLGANPRPCGISGYGARFGSSR